MSAFAKIKCLLTSLLAFYAVYLFAYKCDKLNESALEHSIKSVLHPTSHYHNQACDAINKGHAYVQPYFTKAHKFLDSHVHSHPYFIEYKIESKLAAVKAAYFAHLHPLVVHLFELIEVAEAHIYNYAMILFHKSLVVAKTAAGKAGDAAKDAAGKVSDAADNAADQAARKIQ